MCMFPESSFLILGIRVGLLCILEYDTWLCDMFMLDSGHWMTFFKYCYLSSNICTEQVNSWRWTLVRG
jgi:hypothetical protein